MPDQTTEGSYSAPIHLSIPALNLAALGVVSSLPRRIASSSTEELRQQVRETISEARALRERLQVLHQLQADPRMSRDARLRNETDASARQRALSEVITMHEVYLATWSGTWPNGVA
jgi:hypothetical protein